MNGQLEMGPAQACWRVESRAQGSSVHPGEERAAGLLASGLTPLLASRRVTVLPMPQFAHPPSVCAECVGRACARVGACPSVRSMREAPLAPEQTLGQAIAAVRVSRRGHRGPGCWGASWVGREGLAGSICFQISSSRSYPDRPPPTPLQTLPIADTHTPALTQLHAHARHSGVSRRTPSSPDSGLSAPRGAQATLVPGCGWQSQSCPPLRPVEGSGCSKGGRGGVLGGQGGVLGCRDGVPGARGGVPAGPFRC